MKKNVIKLLGIAFGVALLSTFLFYRLLIGKLASPNGEGQSVVVAARKLAAGATIGPADVSLAVIPLAPNATGTYSTREQTVGLVVLEAIEAKQPITEANVAARDSKMAAGARILAGMRAVSIHVADSSGVVAMLRPGQRVDIHAIGNQNGGTQLRTLLQNVEVISNAPAEVAPGRGATQVVTVVVKPEQAELLALADSGARVRLALRNPSDNAQQVTRRLAVNQLFDGTAPAARQPVETAAIPGTSATGTQTGGDSSVTLLVRMLGAAPSVLEELGAELVSPPQRQTLQVSAFRPESNLEARLSRLGAKQLVEVLSASRLVAKANREVSVQAGAEWPGRGDASGGHACGLRIQFAPTVSRRGIVRLRLQPELRALAVEGLSSRKVETEIELADRQSCLVSGLLDSAAIPSLLDRLFPGRVRAEANREFLVVVTPQLARRVETAELRPAR